MIAHSRRLHSLTDADLLRECRLRGFETAAEIRERVGEVFKQWRPMLQNFPNVHAFAVCVEDAITLPREHLRENRPLEREEAE